MLMTMAAFRRRVATDMGGLVRELQDHTRRYGSAEAEAWSNSLPLVAEAFSAPSFQPIHVLFGDQGRLSLEYRLPASSAWCDMVLLGEHNQRPATVVVELKNWLTRGDRPGSFEGLVERQGRQDEHPSDQVRGYVNYCQRFHSAVQAHDAAVHGCVLFTRDHFCGAYEEPPNDRLVEEFPCFSLRPDDVSRRLPEFFRDRLTSPNEAFALEFERGRYTQDRAFCRQIAEQVLAPESSPFELLDNQRRAFNICLGEIKKPPGFRRRLPRKKVIIIVGPPGSGKSVIAARLWAALIREKSLPEGSAVIATTSVSQNSNWRGLFRGVGAGRAAEGVVVSANQYIPITTQDVGIIRSRHPTITLDDPSNWRDHLKTIAALGFGRERPSDNAFLISIVDEAHALINPEHADARGQFGFAVAAGPQGYHIIRCSVVSIFLLDPRQGFRERETTSIEDIKGWAAELGAEVVEEISLEGSQFRCAGMSEYTEWVDRLLAGDDLNYLGRLCGSWILSRFGVQSRAGISTEGFRVGEAAPRLAEGGSVTSRKGLEFGILPTPSALESQLRQKLADGDSARLLASYARRWVTKGVATPHKLPASAMDFHIPYIKDGQQKLWSRVWNFIPGGNDYTAFVQAQPGYPMAADPLCEVGCPYAVRGFDFDYVGVLWLSDLVVRNGRWIVQLDHVHESGLRPQLRRARKEKDPDGEHHQELMSKIGQAYRILLTRAIKGVFLWFEDQETAQYVKAAARI